MSRHAHSVPAGRILVIALLTSLLALHCKGNDMSYDPEASAEERGKVVRAMRFSNDRAAVEPLIQAVRSDPDASIRETAVVGLGHLGDPAAIEALGQVARFDESFDVRRRAIEALGRIRDARTAEVLATLWREGDGHEGRITNQAVRMAMVPMGSAAVPALVKSLKHPSFHARWMVAEALAEIGDPAALDALRALPEDENPTAQAAITEAIQALEAKSGP